MCRGRPKKVLAMVMISESDRTKRERKADVGGRRGGRKIDYLLIFGGK